MVRHICYVTGTRADFGLMESTLLRIERKANLEISLAVTGTHFSQAYGTTIDEVKKSGLSISGEVVVDVSQTTGSMMAKNIAIILDGLVTLFEKNKPDIVLLLGDRGEMLAGALAAIHLNIPIVHIHGGERSGTVDEPVRHAISKLAHYHLVATEQSRNRLIRMGEYPEHIYVTGAPGLDAIVNFKVEEKTALLHRYSLSPDEPFILILFHPVVQQLDRLSSQVNNLLSVVLERKLPALILMPNSDAGGQLIKEEIRKFEDCRQLKIAVHIPRNDFLSLLTYADVLAGNSSSGIIEAASLSTPVLNIGTRQNFRERNANVVDAGISQAEIRKGFDDAIALRGQQWENVYGQGTAADHIVQFLTDLTIDEAILEKVNAY